MTNSRSSYFQAFYHYDLGRYLSSSLFQFDVALVGMHFYVHASVGKYSSHVKLNRILRFCNSDGSSKREEDWPHGRRSWRAVHRPLQHQPGATRTRSLSRSLARIMWSQAFAGAEDRSIKLSEYTTGLSKEDLGENSSLGKVPIHAGERYIYAPRSCQNNDSTSQRQVTTHPSLVSSSFNPKFPKGTFKHLCNSALSTYITLLYSKDGHLVLNPHGNFPHDRPCDLPCHACVGF